MDEAERIERFVADAEGASVTEERLSESVGSRRLHAVLRDDERPHHVLRGRLLDLFDVSGGTVVEESQTRKIPSKGTDLVTVVTDRRVLVVVQRPEEPDVIEIPVGDIEEATHEAALGTNTRLRLLTGDRAYLVDTSGSEEAHGEDAVEFLEEFRERTDGAESSGARAGANATEAGTEPGAGTDVFEAIERLADLNERGALTDAEFAEKKRELLDRL